MKKFYTLFLILLSLTIQLSAQFSIGTSPYSFSNEGLTADIPSVKMPAFDLEQMMAEDELYYSQKGQPYRFGKTFDVNLNLDNFGVWETLDNGDRIWRAMIESTDAKSINLIYDDFNMPPGARFHLYDESHEHLLGAFTEINNKSNNRFATSLIKGEKTYLEYYEPAAVNGQGIISISEVIHGYKDFYNKEQKDYGDSGSCNNNVNCPESAGWEDEINSVAMILEGNFRACSGAMINNVAEDCTPYFLTANHCVGGNSYQNWILMFNYQSPGCTNEDGPTNQTVQGTSLVANWGNTDFFLVEVTEPIPPDYNVYLAGFSADPAPATSVTGIHHPAGDIKKITFDSDTVIDGSFGGSATGTHWEVTEWDDGTTEGGSSGSPLFDQNHRIIGQLHGGSASCFNTSGYDVYGKVAESWEGNGSTASRLMDWLDPNDTGILFVDGRYCSEADFDLDAAVSSATPTGTSCNNIVNPQFSLSNQGNDPLTEIVIEYGYGSETFTYTWTGELEFPSSTIIELPEIDVPTGDYELSINIISTNGIDQDENEDNDATATNFEIINGETINFSLSTDGYADETSIEITNEDGDMIYTQSGFSNNSEFDDAICTQAGCYTLTVIDSWGDGINNYTDDEGDDGIYTITNSEGEVLVEDGGLFGDCTGQNMPEGCSESYEFCIESSNPNALAPSFEANELVICPGGSVQFTDLTDGPVDGWEWDFGGQGTSTEQNPEFVFDTVGEYNITLTVSNDTENETFTQNSYIQVIETTTANFTVDEVNGLDIVLSNTSELAESWTFTVNDETFTDVDDLAYTFPAAGTYNICINSQNLCGLDIFCEDVEVDCLALEASFDYATSSTTENTLDLETDLIDGYTYSWDFGDGNTSDEAILSYTWEDFGIYEVCLSITNQCDNTETSCQEVEITCPPADASFDIEVNDAEATFTALGFAIETYSWTVDGQAVEGEESINYEFPLAGDYEVCLEVVNACEESNIICDQVSITTELYAIAPAFASDVQVICIGETVLFTDLSSGIVDSWAWDFGGLGTSEDQDPEFTFEEAGSFTISLSVSNEYFTEVSTQNNYIVVSSGPSPNFSFEIDDLTVSFEDESDGAEEWSWAIGDTPFSDDQNPEYTFDDNDLVTICLTVTNDCGSNQICQEITPSCPEISAELSYDNAGNDFSFEVDAEGQIDSYSWDFGDGNTDDGASVEHTYESNGDFEVCVSVIDACGESVEECTTVNVSGVSIDHVNTIGINVYPNPSNGLYQIDLPNTSKDVNLKVFATDGQLIIGQSVNTNAYTLNISDLAPAVYFLQIEMNGVQYFERLVKTN